MPCLSSISSVKDPIPCLSSISSVKDQIPCLSSISSVKDQISCLSSISPVSSVYSPGMVTIGSRNKAAELSAAQASSAASGSRETVAISRERRGRLNARCPLNRALYSIYSTDVTQTNWLYG